MRTACDARGTPWTQRGGECWQASRQLLVQLPPASTAANVSVRKTSARGAVDYAYARAVGEHGCVELRKCQCVVCFASALGRVSRYGI